MSDEFLFSPKGRQEGSTKFKRSECDGDTPSREKLKRKDRANKDEKCEKAILGFSESCPCQSQNRH
jgi:hypothetical protein